MVIPAITASRTIRPSLVKSAQAILKHRYGLCSEQRILIIHDRQKTRLGKSFAAAARLLGVKADIFALGSGRFIGNTHELLASLIKSGGYVLFLNILEGRPEEVSDRIRLANAERAAGGKVAHSPGLKESMIRTPVDYPALMETARNLLGKLKGAGEAELKSPAGTDLRINIEGREFHDDVLPKAVDVGNLPCGEVYCAPLEDAADGTLVADASASGFGMLPQPLKFEISRGKIVGLSWLARPSFNSALLKRIRGILFQDDGASLIGELGIGLAPFSICGNLLQDEKVAGTVHVAFGNNSTFGGRNNSRSHIDFLVRNPVLRILYPNQRPPQVIVREGELLL